MSTAVADSTPRLAPGRTPPAYWSLDPNELAKQLQSTSPGLSGEEAARRLRTYGPNDTRERRELSRLDVLSRQLRSPLLLLLVFAASASLLAGEWVDTAVVLIIVVMSVFIGYSREYSAQTAAAALQTHIRTRCTVIRGGDQAQVPMEDVVPEDLVLLSAGSVVPADAVILDSTDFFVSEAVLTGESLPVHTAAGALAASAELRERSNCVFLGTNVRSGSARCLVVKTGAATEFGGIAHRLVLRPPETEFDRGIRHFGYLLTSVMSIVVLVVFVGHMLLGRPPIETLLFSVALAVGLSPELLPAILSVNLTRSAQAMAHRGVLVRRLNAIENLGSMTVLCTDKTGTITEGVVQLDGAFDDGGRPDQEVLELGAWNAALETGIASALDEAITNACRPDLGQARKLGEIPFDFVRKRVTVVMQAADRPRLVMKGAFHHVLEACTCTSDGAALGAGARAELERRYD
jgi:Mg2+-importing ATPase